MMDSDRYLLLLALAVFFGLFALSIVSLRGSGDEDTPYSVMCPPAEAITMADTGPPMTCYTPDELKSYIALQKNYSLAMAADLYPQGRLEIYQTTAPSDGARYFAVALKPDETGAMGGCLVAEGAQLQHAAAP